MEEKKSRMQELRQKIAANHPPIDPERLLFGSALVGVAEDEFKGCINNDAFEARLFEEFKKAGAPKQVKAWLRKRLQTEFLSAESPPNWGTDSPQWPFFGERPMTFIRQFPLPDNEVTNSHVTSGVMLYVFAVREHLDAGGFVVHYRVVERLTNIQTAEDHYCEEEEHAKKRREPS